MKLFSTFCCAALALCSAIYAQSPIDHMTVHFNTPVLVGESRSRPETATSRSCTAHPTASSSSARKLVPLLWRR